MTEGIGPSPAVVCIGESMLMLAPPRTELIEYAPQYTVLLGGAEANVAIGLERLGIRAGWIGKLPRNALGRRIVNETRASGVDTSRVVWTDTGRVGIFFVEWGSTPRPIATIYDRAGSTAATLAADELDWDYILGARWLHLTGINPALSETSRIATLDMARRARAGGMSVSFDVNYRSLLWTREQARECIAEILPHVNLLVATEQDTEMLLGRATCREDALEEMVRFYGLDVAVTTLGKDGALAFDGSEFYRAGGHVVETVNRLGAGDAFVAGMLYGYPQSGIQAGLEYGAAMSAIKMTIPQNTPLVTKDDVEQLLANRQRELLR
jgi:2-dehydro-3-deoxygluconokinase